MDYSPKQVNERLLIGVDFVRFLKNRPGVTVISATWRNTVAFGMDANPSAMLQGVAMIVDSVVSTWTTGGVPGVGYYPKCDATLSNGEVVTLPDPDEGLLVVRS